MNFSCLSIASVDGKQHLIEVDFPPNGVNETTLSTSCEQDSLNVFCEIRLVMRWRGEFMPCVAPSGGKAIRDIEITVNPLTSANDEPGFVAL